MKLVSIVSQRGAKAQAIGRSAQREAPWSSHIRAVDAALAKKNVNSAMRAWLRAHDAALASRRWEGLMDVGDAALRIGEVAGLPRALEARARWIYLAALLLARERASLDGVLRTAEAFAARGEREVVNQCVGVAEQLAARAPRRGAPERLRAAKERLATLLLIAERHALDALASAGARRGGSEGQGRTKGLAGRITCLPDLESNPLDAEAARALASQNGGKPHRLHGGA